MAGLHCPRCNSTTLRTIDTRKTGKTIRRKRECHHCGAQFYTTEAVQTEEVAK
jgi:transcriptional repressor NrdR